MVAIRTSILRFVPIEIFSKGIWNSSCHICPYITRSNDKISDLYIIFITSRITRSDKILISCPTRIKTSIFHFTRQYMFYMTSKLICQHLFIEKYVCGGSAFSTNIISLHFFFRHFIQISRSVIVVFSDFIPCVISIRSRCFYSSCS
jgi:hypothetical protein